MKIAFMHYHLKTGGVTTCIAQQVEALKNDCEMLVISGQMPQAPFAADTVCIPQLAYSTEYRELFDPKEIAGAIYNAIQARFNGPCDIVHVHNPLLAKNKKFLSILKALQKKDTPLFLQVHDFAEDGRPLSYFAEDYLTDCHYSVVNSRDYQILLKAGLKKEGLHQLFNPVSRFDSQLHSADGGSSIVYPIRAIRRKNIGEAILLSLLFGADQSLVITLPPNSPADIKSYADWKAFVADHHLNVKFDQGLNHPFEAIVHSARYLITTSITEGFGFSFIEPWLYEKLVWGRKLKDICSDFEAKGIRLDHMYTRLNVPIDWVGSENFFKKWTAAIHRAAELFGVQLPKDLIQQAFDFITADGTIDLGLLNESFQKQVILRLLSDKAHMETLLKLNPFLEKIANVHNEKDIIKTNCDAVARNYNLSLYRQKLLEIYQSVIANPVKQRIAKKILLAEFLDLTKFSLLKWSDYEI
jgi:hypothetical protein